MASLLISARLFYDGIYKNAFVLIIPRIVQRGLLLQPLGYKLCHILRLRTHQIQRQLNPLSV